MHPARHIAAIATIACALVLAGCNHPPRTAPEAGESTSLPPTTHPEQFIADARVMLAKGNPRAALADLARLSATDAERPDALDVRRKALQAAGIPDPDDPANRTLADRNAVASEMQKDYFSNGQEVVLRPDGVDGRSLRLRYSFLTRKFVYAFANDEARLQKLQDTGFRDVYLSDGFEELWYLPLVPGAKPERQAKVRAAHPASGAQQ